MLNGFYPAGNGTLDRCGRPNGDHRACMGLHDLRGRQYSKHGWQRMQGMSMPVMQTWHLNDFLLTFLMWIVMMAGMMMPSAARMIFAFLGVKRWRQADPTCLLATFIFALAT